MQETYELEDCLDYDTLTTDNGLFSIASGNPTITYSNNGLTITGSGASSDQNIEYQNQLPNVDYIIEFDISSTPLGYSSCIAIEGARTCKSDSGGLYTCLLSGGSDFYNVNPVPSTPIHIKQEVTGSTTKSIKYYVNDVLKSTNNVPENSLLQLKTYQSRTITIKNLKIKAL